MVVANGVSNTVNPMGLVDFFSVIQSIATVGALIVSIIVFVNTIQRSDKEHKNALYKETLHIFLGNVNEYLKMIDPQEFYDYYEIIYSGKPYERPKIYKDIKHFSANIRYKSQETLIYMPDSIKTMEIVVNMLMLLERGALAINEIFCIDIDKEERGLQVNSSLCDGEIMRFEERYNEVVAFVFKGIRITQEYMFDRTQQISKYISEYECKYKNEI